MSIDHIDVRGIHSSPPAIGYFYGPSGRQYKLPTKEELERLNVITAPPPAKDYDELEDFNY